jgi:hypothetical protein
MRHKILPDLDGDGFADVDALHQRLQQRRVWLGAAAAVLSVALHLFIAMRLPAIMLPHADAVKAEIYKTFKVNDVAPAPRSAQPTRPEASTSLKPGPGFNVQSDAITLKRMVDEVKLAPQPLPAGSLESLAGAPPTPLAPKMEAWSPREEILKVEDRLVREEIPDRPRRLIPDVTRIKGAADVTLPVEAPRKVGDGQGLSDAAKRSVADARPPSVSAADTQWDRLEDLLRPAPGPRLGSGAAEAGGGRRAPETVAMLPPSTGEPLKPIEGMLKATLSVYADRSDPDYTYGRVDIQRAGADTMPVLPKDILFIQDTSGSITEQRLALCREGLLRCLAQLAPRDRFNLVEFRDAPRRCFTDWAPATAPNLETARAFVRAMESRGYTDIYASLRELLAMERRPVRPVIVILVSDGLPTAGLRDSAEIISAFTRENRGAVSIFAMATFDLANLYLLDMLSYMNRGDSVAARRGRFSIPDVMDGQFTGVSRPVLSDMQFRFSSPGAEMVPSLTPNLYLDRSLVLYGRFPKNADRVVFQVVGRSGEQGCDMVFDLKMADAVKGDAGIREEWAWHKIYGLIGEHTRTRDPAMVRDIKRVSSAYGLKVPYADELK